MSARASAKVAASPVRAERSGGKLPVPAFVLHRYDWSETSLILELFTRSQGRVAAIAKGAKRPYSQLRSVLLPFQRLLVQTSHKKGDEGSEVQLLRSAEWAGGGAMLGGQALLAGFYLNELLLKGLARHDAHPELFDAYAATLPALAGQGHTLDDDEDRHGASDGGGLARDADMRLQAALRSFELMLLQALGFLPELDVLTLSQGALKADVRYALRPDVGLTRAPANAPDEGLSAATLAALQSALSARDLPALHQAVRPALQPLKTQLRACLHYHLETDRLRTRQVMIDAQRLIDSAHAARPDPVHTATTPKETAR